MKRTALPLALAVVLGVLAACTEPTTPATAPPVLFGTIPTDSTSTTSTTSVGDTCEDGTSTCRGGNSYGSGS